jgi:cytidine deaminase
LKKLHFTSEFNCYDNENELSESHFILTKLAIEATKNAYAPYSQFFVGAAIELSSGVVVQGSNQENAAYPSGLCAERVALFHIGHQFPHETIKTIAITAQSSIHDTQKPVVPCGACMQVISEFEKRQNKPITIILHGNNGQVYECIGLKNLMPLSFELK